MDRTISFYSVRSRGMTTELRLVREYLEKNIPDAVFHYFLLREDKNEASTVDARKARTEYSKKADVVICMDSSVPRKFPGTAGDRILLLDLYDNLFELYLEYKQGKGSRRQGFSAMTHIVAGSPFGEKLLKNCYELPDQKEIISKPLPVAQYLSNEKNQLENRAWIDARFPHARGKKLMGLLFSRSAEDDRNLFAGHDLTAFLDQLGDQWFVVTDSVSFGACIREKASIAGEKIGTILSRSDNYHVAGSCDLLVTDNSFQATAAAGRKIPILCLHVKDNAFSSFMEEEYPGMYLKDLNAFGTLCADQIEYTEEQERFYREFFYESDSETLEQICMTICKKDLS